MKNIDLNRLRVFVKIVNAGSLTRAAQGLGLPKSRVSRILASLEKHVGHQLLYRTTRNLQLTEAGKNLFLSCQDSIYALELAEENIKSNTYSYDGLIRMTTTADFGVQVLPGLIAKFRREYPLLQFDILLSQDYVDLVKESVDLAIRFGKMPDSSLRALKIGTISMILVASPKFLELHPSLSKLESILEIPCIGIQGSSRRAWRLSDGNSTKELKVKPVIEANDPAAICSLAIESQGLAFLPDHLCRDAILRGELQQVFRNWKSEAAPVHLVNAYKKDIPLRVKVFSEFLARELASIF